MPSEMVQKEGRMTAGSRKDMIPKTSHCEVWGGSSQTEITAPEDSKTERSLEYSRNQWKVNVLGVGREHFYLQ